MKEEAEQMVKEEDEVEQKVQGAESAALADALPEAEADTEPQGGAEMAELVDSAQKPDEAEQEISDKDESKSADKGAEGIEKVDIEKGESEQKAEDTAQKSDLQSEERVEACQEVAMTANDGTENITKTLDEETN